MQPAPHTDHGEMFNAVVRRLQREASYLSAQWLEPWLALQAGADDDDDKGGNKGVKRDTASSSAIASVLPEVDDLSPQRAALAIIHDIATLKAAAMASQPSSSADHHDGRRLFHSTVSSTREFESRVGHFVPLPLAPVSLLLINALDDLEGREQAMRGLLDLCDTTYIPGLLKGKESAATRQQVALYKKLKIELKRVFFTLSIEIIPWLREFVSWYKAPDVRGPPAASQQRATAGTTIHDKTYVSITSTDDEDDAQGGLGFGRALSLVEIPVDEDALEHYERQRRDELRQVGQQVRELRELQEYANTLVAEHGTKLEHAVEEADIALDNATASRVQLTLAAKYKIAGAALTGALVGGLLGGPLGLIAGAKSATTIGLVALAGGATGSVVGSTVASTTAARSAAVDEDYQIQREKDHLHAQ
jgi:hypothetical protein